MSPRPRRHSSYRLHHITTRGNNRRSIFEDAEDRERFYDLLDVGISASEVRCHQDVQMGNHVHLLLEGEMTAVSALMWFVSHRYALAYNQRHGRLNHLLGRRFHASDVPDGRAARAVCVYIAMNPVRAGLCEHPADWVYGSFPAAIGRRRCAPARFDHLHRRTLRAPANDAWGRDRDGHRPAARGQAGARRHPPGAGRPHARRTSVTRGRCSATPPTRSRRTTAEARGRSYGGSRVEVLTGPEGFEPPTGRFEACCSIP